MRIDHRVVSSIQRLTARAANTMVRWASIESRVLFDPGGHPFCLYRDEDRSHERS